MSSEPFLSVCIPTFNRADFLAVALESVAEQWRPGLEVVVSDNASTDDTAAVVASFAERLGAVRYLRHEKNQGFDANYAASVKAARGTFTWTLGDDDWVEAGAIARVFDILEARRGAIGLTGLCTTYGPEGDFIARPEQTGVVESVRGADRIIPHRNLGFLFANMSLHVFSTAAAQAVLADKHLFHAGCSCHHLMCWLAQRHQEWLYVDEPIAAWRAGNDSFATNGLLKRARLALTAYEANMADVFGAGSETYRRFMNEQQTIIARQVVLRAKNVERLNKHMRPYHCGPAERWRINVIALRVLYRFPRYWRDVAPLYLVPGPVIGAASAAKQWLREARARSR